MDVWNCSIMQQLIRSICFCFCLSQTSPPAYLFIHFPLFLSISDNMKKKLLKFTFWKCFFLFTLVCDLALLFLFLICFSSTIFHFLFLLSPLLSLPLFHPDAFPLLLLFSVHEVLQLSLCPSMRMCLFVLHLSALFSAFIDSIAVFHYETVKKK